MSLRTPRLVSAFFVLAALLGTPPVTNAAASCPEATFCAGAAGADITPPVSTPMWGYTARHGVLASDNVPNHLADAGEAIAAGDLAGAVAAAQRIRDEHFVHDKTSLDTELYEKTFVANRGIHLRLFANAWVLHGTSGTKVAIVQTDLGGLPGEVHQAVANRLTAAGIGVDRDHLMLTATHTHQGPGGIFQYQGYALLGGDEFDPRVFDAVVGGITRAIVRANARLAPAKLAIGQITTHDANRNRRVSPQWCENPENLCDANLKPTPQSPPTNDPLATVIRVDRADGVPLGVITNFAAHGTIGGDGNLLFSGDNQGWATRLVTQGIAKAYGKALPRNVEIVDALVNGAQGDQSPIGDAGPWNWSDSTNRQYAAMEDAGRRQAAFVLQEWQALGSQLHTDVDVDARFEFLCFCGQQIDDEFVYDGPKIDKTDPMWNHIAPYASLGAADITLDEGTSSPVVMPAQGHKLPALGGVGTNPSITRMQILRIDDLLIAGVPGEPNVTAGRRIGAVLLGVPGASALYSNAIIAGLANDYDSYYATPEEYTAYQYEGSFTLFGPQSVPLLTQEFVGLAKRMIAGTSVPDCDIPFDLAFCATHPVHPDTSATAFPPTPTLPDPPPLIEGEPPASAPRMSTASFSWRGGSPSAEWRPDQDRVEIQRRTPGGWQTMFGDTRGTATILRYLQEPGAYHWTAQWDIAPDVPAGTYRFHIRGAVALQPGIRTPYTLDSTPFVVTKVTTLAWIASAVPESSTARIQVSYPAIDPLNSFRWRAAGPTCDATVTLASPSETVVVHLEQGSGTVDLLPGQQLTSVHCSDAWGNRTA